MAQHKRAPGFDSINDLIQARDTRNAYFRKALADSFGRLTKRERSKPNPLALRGLFSS